MEVPIAFSTAASLPEVAGDACIYFFPDSRGEMKEAMETLLTDEEKRRDLIQKGKERSKAFPWGRTARETEAVIMKVFDRQFGG